jgi:elongation factor Tu
MDPQIGGIRKIRSKHSGMALEVLGSGTNDGQRVVQNPYVGSDNQKFTFEPVGDGYYKIVAKHSGKVLDVEGWGTDDGAWIQQWAYLDPPLNPPGHNDNQRWAIEPG